MNSTELDRYLKGIQIANKQVFKKLSEGRTLINQNQCSMALNHIFKTYSHFIPLPTPQWYSAVFINFDQDKDGFINLQEFNDLVLQYYQHYASSPKKTPIQEKLELRKNQNNKPSPYNDVIYPPKVDYEKKTPLSPKKPPSSPERPSQNVTFQDNIKSPKSNLLAKKHPVFESKVVYPRHRKAKQIFDDYVFLRDTGAGSFATVQIVKSKQSGQIRAAKMIIINSRDQLEFISKEIELLKELDHPHIVKLYETYHDNMTIYLILEYCEGGELFDRLVYQYEQIKEPITEEQVTIWMRQILSACTYCHEKGMVHRDIKPENLFFLTNSPNSDLKLGDFGLSDRMSRIRNTAYTGPEKGNVVHRLLKNINPYRAQPVYMQKAGTLHYMAPEMIRANYDEKCDLFSVGIIMYQLLVGIHPFMQFGDTEDKVKDRILKEQPSFAREEWSYVSNEAKDLVLQLLEKDPHKRLSARDALNHRWFKNSKQKTNRPTGLTVSVIENLRDWQNLSSLKKLFIHLIAKEIPDSNIKDFRSKFEAIDIEGTGVLSVDLLKQTMINSQFHFTSQELDDILASIDTQNTGYIGYNDFISVLISRRATLNVPILRVIFTKLDVQKTGRISFEDFKNLFKLNTLSNTNSGPLKQFYRELDRNNDGSIDFDDFCAYMLKK